MSLAAMIEEAEASWGRLVARADFDAYLARLPAAPLPRISELYLCCAAAAGHASALCELERRFFPEIDRVLRALDRDGDLTDEVKQLLRHKLFVAAPGTPPGITKFEGRGPLGRWLQIVATREALMHLRTTRRERARSLDLVPRDLELDVLRRDYRVEFERAFADALAGLTSKDRNLITYHLVGRLSLDQIGAIYGVHRVTAFRWLRLARAALVDRTRALLTERMKLRRDELDSLLRMVQSRASVSVERLLRQATASP